MTTYTLDQIPASVREARTAEAFAHLDDSDASLAFRIRVWRDRRLDLLKRFAVIAHPAKSDAFTNEA